MRLFLANSGRPDPDRVDRNQQSDQAFVGFTDFVRRLLSEQGPSLMVFAFDESLKTSARKQIYPDYKANRAPAPDSLKRQFGWCRQWLEALGLSAVSSESWEADDLIGSLARYHRKPDRPVVILTADKDLAQLLHEQDIWWSFLDDKRLDYRGVIKKFGVRPDQIADQLALTGDKVDNIPGVPGVGQKTAARLLKKYDSLARLYQHLGEVGEMKFRYSGQVQASLIEHCEQLKTSARLTRINCNIEAMEKVCLRRGRVDEDRLQQMMDEHDFEPARRRNWEKLMNMMADAVLDS